MKKTMRRALPFFLLVALLLAEAPAYAVQAEDLSPEDYDLEALESGACGWETDLQLLGEYEPNVIIIKFKDPGQFPGREKQYQDAVDKVLRTGFEEIGERTYLVQTDELSRDPRGVLNRFKNNRYIEYVEPNYIGSMELTPTDPDYAAYGFAFTKYTNAEAGWDIATVSPVTVGIVDTGYSGSSDLPAASGYSIYNKNTDLTDLAGHGTQVAGTLGAMGGNGIMNAGVVWNASILPVKISESTSVTVANVAPGIIYAADHGARIINLSLSFTTDSVTLKNAVDYAYSKGCLLVAAAGNKGTASVTYPAAYHNVMGVGGTANGTDRYRLSNYGEGLDVLAGWSWYTVTSHGGNIIASGTSIAAPQVSGLAALVWGLDPSLTNDQVARIIRENTNRAGGVWDAQTGYGTIDMGKTLAAVAGASGPQPETPSESNVPSVPETPAVPEERDTEPPVITLKGGTELTMEEGGTYEEPGYTALDNQDGDITGDVTVSGSIAAAYAGEYTLTYRVADRAGNIGTAERRVVVEAAPDPPADEPTPPTITQNGSNPIILHMGGTPYTEQGAQAYDERDGDLSAFVVTEGTVDTTRPGAYQVTYSVTNSAGLSSSVTREVRVLAPQESVSRTPYNFNGQGKAGASQIYSAHADASGEVELSVSGLTKATVSVSVSDSSGAEVFSETFTGNGTRTFQVSEGDCQIATSIVTAKGNGKYGLSLLMPEVVTVSFAEEEVPLAASPFANHSSVLTIIMVCINVLTLVGIAVIIVLLTKKQRIGRR